MLQSNIVLKAKEYIKILLFDIDKSNWYFYHNLEHTLDVFERASYLAYKEWLDEELKELIQISALFHDVWFADQYDENEPLWAEKAQDFLIKENFPEDKIDIIKNTIIDTIPSKIPSSKLWFIIKDADMDNLWRQDFFEKNKNLYKELKIIKNLDVDKQTWLENSLKLLKSHKFYTQTQQEERTEQFVKNKKELERRVKMKD